MAAALAFASMAAAKSLSVPHQVSSDAAHCLCDKDVLHCLTLTTRVPSSSMPEAGREGERDHMFWPTSKSDHMYQKNLIIRQ